MPICTKTGMGCPFRGEHQPVDEFERPLGNKNPEPFNTCATCRRKVKENKARIKKVTGFPKLTFPEFDNPIRERQFREWFWDCIARGRK